jgi:UPF0042 nucleotide-binding protein
MTMDLLLIGGVSGSARTWRSRRSRTPATTRSTTCRCRSSRDGALCAEAGRDRVAIALDVKVGPGLDDLPTRCRAAQHGRLERAFPLSRRQDRDAGQAFLRDAPPPSVLERLSARSPRRSSTSARFSLTCARWAFAFDTSELSAAALRAWIKDFVSVDASKLTLLFESFGFKHGVPLDADLVFDIRCLPNPHYEPRCRR